MFRRVRRNGWNLIALFIIAFLSVAAAPHQKEIAELYRRGLAGEKDAVEKCIAKLEDALKAQPQNQTARVYLGSAYTLRSRDLDFGLKKLEALRHGLALMDEAVAAAPNDPKVRLARALTTSELPAIFGRSSSTRKDFELLADVALRAPEKFDTGDRQIIFYQAAISARSAGDKTRASLLLRAAAQSPDDPKLSQKISDELARMK